MSNIGTWSYLATAPVLVGDCLVLWVTPGGLCTLHSCSARPICSAWSVSPQHEVLAWLLPGSVVLPPPICSAWSVTVGSVWSVSPLHTGSARLSSSAWPDGSTRSVLFICLVWLGSLHCGSARLPSWSVGLSPPILLVQLGPTQFGISPGHFLC